jgi:CBS domain containing-hemolysin-like protein
MNFLRIFLLLLLVALNAFFVAVEYAAIASRRSKLEMLIEHESAASRIVKDWLQNPLARDRLIAANQIYITIISLALGAIGANAVQEMLSPLFLSIHLSAKWEIINSVISILPLVISLILVTGIQVVLGEQVPKVTVLRSPERFALFAAPIMRVLNSLFRKFIDLLDWATKQTLKLFGISITSTQSSQISIEEIKLMVSGPEMGGLLEKPEQEMLSAIFDFGSMVVRQVCVPRTDIVAVEESTSLKGVIQLFTQENVTKIPVYKENLDQITGILYIRDLLTALYASDGKLKIAADIVREALFVPETISVNDLLVQFKNRRQHIAIVLDEYAGTAGLVTLEDLVEEIVGDYRDSFDSNTPQIQPLTEGKALIDGLILIPEFNEYFGMTLSDPNYNTVAGYILGKLGRLPLVGDIIEDSENHISLKVESMDRMRITQVLVTRLKADHVNEIKPDSI